MAHNGTLSKISVKLLVVVPVIVLQPIKLNMIHARVTRIPFKDSIMQRRVEQIPYKAKKILSNVVTTQREREQTPCKVSLIARRTIVTAIKTSKSKRRGSGKSI